MTTSATTCILSKPTGRNKISGAAFAYMQTRNRMRAFNAVHAELEKSGLTKAELADRTGKGADRIAHLLGAPGNWTLDTISSLLYAISGAEIEYRISYPLDQIPRNQHHPAWLFPEKSAVSEDNAQVPDDHVTNEVAVVMLPGTLKFLSEPLKKLVEFIEKSDGGETSFDAAKLAPFEKAIAEITSSDS